MVKLKLGTILILALFIIGAVTYSYALIEKARSGAPFHIILGNFAALLTIVAMFAAIIGEWLGVLD